MIKYLKSKQHYIDLYDRFTVERCRRWEKICLADDGKPMIYEGKEMNKEQALQFRSWLFNYTIWFKKGDEYECKDKTIREWMDKDEARDALVESARAPADIRCLTCYALMDVESKDLCTWLGDKERVIFMYKCPNEHYPMRSFFADGKEHRTKPKVCPKCQTTLDVDYKKNGEHKVTTIETCPSCKYTNTEEMDFTVRKEKVDKNFEKDRARFCITEKEGQEYTDFKINMDGIKELLDKHNEREKDKDVYDQVAKLQKLTVVDLEKLLVPILKKASYIKLQLGQPDMGKDLFLPFTVQDAKSERQDMASTHDLQNLLKKVLGDTNWRLMSEGTSYRVGILSGRLRAYEREEDQLELIRLREKKLSKVSKL